MGFRDTIKSYFGHSEANRRSSQPLARTNEQSNPNDSKSKHLKDGSTVQENLEHENLESDNLESRNLKSEHLQAGSMKPENLKTENQKSENSGTPCPEPDVDVARNLWDDAYERLDAKVLKDYEDKLLQQNECNSGRIHDSPPVDIDQLQGHEREVQIAQILEDQEVSIQKSHKRIKICGKETTVQEAVNKIATTVIWAKDFIASALSSEPHAALAWAGVSILLPILTNPAEQDAAAIEGLDCIQRVLCRYRVIEQVYFLPGQIQAQLDNRDGLESLREHVVELYRLVLEFQIRLANQHANKFVKRIARDIAKRDDWKTIKDDIETRDKAAQDMSDALKLERDASAQQKVKEQLDIQEKQLEDVASGQLLILTKFDDFLEGLERKKLEQDDKDCLDAFNSPLNYKEQKNRNDSRAAGTGLWLVQNHRLLQFVTDENSGLFYVTGTPGMGKSVLMRSALEDVLPPTINGAVGYFFFKDESDAKRSASEALSAVIHQVLLQRPHLITTVKELAKDRKNIDLQNIRTHLSQIWKLLVKLSESYAEVICCVFDALDECADNGDLIQLVDEYCQKPTGKLKFIISARPHYDLENKFACFNESLQNNVHLEGEEQPLGEDVDRIIDAKIEAWGKNSIHVSETTMDHVRGKLMERSSDTNSFLWLRSVFKLLENDPGLDGKDRTQYVDRLMADLPDDLYELYEKMLARSRDHKRTTEILSVLIAAEQTNGMTLQEVKVFDELRTNTAVVRHSQLEELQEDEYYRNTLREICGHFINFSGDKVFLFHQTAKEFLLERSSSEDAPSKEKRWRNSINKVDAHRAMATLCLRLLELKDFDEDFFRLAQIRSGELWSRKRLIMHIMQRLQILANHKYVGLPYASEYWRLHYRLSLPGSAPVWPNGRPKACNFSSYAFWTWFIHVLAPPYLGQIPKASPSELLSEAMDDESFDIDASFEKWCPSRTAIPESRIVIDESASYQLGSAESGNHRLVWHISKDSEALKLLDQFAKIWEPVAEEREEWHFLKQSVPMKGYEGSPSKARAEWVMEWWNY